MEEAYYANGYTYKFKKLDDGWYGIYRWNEIKQIYTPIIQAKTIEKAKTWCNFSDHSPWLKPGGS